MKARCCINCGFTLVEVLLVIVVISSLGTLGYVATTGVQQGSREKKLESDVANINSAAQLYQTAGGNLSTDADDVISNLQTRATDASAQQIIGMKGSFLDVRVEPVWQTSEEAATSQLRAVWNSSTASFQTTRTGAAGIKEFRLNEARAAEAPSTETRNPTLRGATETQWVWDYTNRDNSVSALGSVPSMGEGTLASNGTVNLVQPLSAPTFSVAGGSSALSTFDKSVSVSNPNPAGSSQVYVSSGGAYTLYSSALTVAPGTTLNAIAYSLDPSRYSNSPTATATYTAIPVTLGIAISAPSTLTYAQAGGAMKSGTTITPSPATISLTSSGIPSQYLNSSNFQISYTLDGSDPATSPTAQQGPSFSGAFVSPSIDISLATWGSATSLNIRAMARALNTSLFTSSPGVTSTITAATTTLAAPVISPASQTVSSSVNVTISDGGVYPTNSRIQYTLDNADPGSGANPTTGTLYSAPFSTGISSVKARAYGPAAYASWFTPSPVATADYTASSTPEGALVGNADVNGTFVGSLIYANPSSNLNFNSGAKILNGNIYFPGTPEIFVENNIQVVAKGQAYVEQGLIPRPASQLASGIAGKQYLADGTEVIPATDTRQIVDLTGSTSPNNYTVRFNKSTYVAGKVFRRSNPPPFPTVVVPTGLIARGSIIQNSGAATVTLSAGRYSSVTVNGGTAIRLGSPGRTATTTYVFDSLTLNGNGRIYVDSPVELYVPSGFNVNSAVFGNVDHPEWLTIKVVSNGVNMNSGSTLYGQIVAPTSSVVVDGTFNGSVVANTLRINGQGVVFSTTPVIN